MQSTLDQKVIYLMLRGARRQEALRRRKPAAGVPARLTGDGWWLDTRKPKPRTTAPRIAASKDAENLPARVTAQGDCNE